MRTLFFDCFAGASGNMILGALFDLGVDPGEFKEQIGMLGLAGYEISIERVDRSGISSVHVDVRIPDETGHRHLSHIKEIIGNSELSQAVKERAAAIFTRLAEAEATVHGTDVEKIHFHEVGALDAIIDIVGACIGFEMLNIDRFACSSLHLGSGFIHMQHGKFPVPPPAVAELLKGKPVYSSDVEGELTTPTGAAIISTLCDSYGLIPEMVVEQIGYGAGTRRYENFPNALRLMIGESGDGGRRSEAKAEDSSAASIEELVLLETNLDDSSPQVVGYAMERAFEIGALDCWVTPILMKKNRPAHLISILCERAKREVLCGMLYTETTTLGIRVRPVERESVQREIRNVATKYGQVRVKFARYNGRIVNIMPEYDDVVRLARENLVPFGTVRDEAVAAVTAERSMAA